MKELSGLFPTGRRLGKYQLIRRIAVGGMAEIYLARSNGQGSGLEGFEKLVVLKKILPQHALDPQLLRMFLDEARLMATLTNPHITQVYDAGSDGDAPFFAMEYVHGANLREIMIAERGLIPLPHAIGILGAAAAGLHYAHEKLGPKGEPLHIVHRDVSPSNVLVTYDGSVKVSDFGIAKWASQRSQTQEGALKGKFAYMSPEQCRGEPLDRRSDVFALGTLLYEVTTGRAPFTGGSDYDILTQIVNGEAAPPSLPGGRYPTALAGIVSRALARRPDDRYPTAQALQLDLESFARDEKLYVSTVALGQYMSALFAERIESWRLAQQSGKSLEQHLAERLDEVESEAMEEARTVTPVTATDAFISPAGEPERERARKPARGAAARAAPAIAALVLLVVVAGGVTVALRWRPGARPAAVAGDAATAAGAAARSAAPSTATAAPLTVESHSASSADQPPQPVLPAGPSGTEPASRDEPRAEAAAAHAASAPGATAAVVRGKRGGRQKGAGDPPSAAAAPKGPSPIERWDPDSPIPP